MTLASIAKELDGKTVVCDYWMVGHPAFAGDAKAVVTVKTGQAYYQSQPIKLTVEGWKSLYADFRRQTAHA